MPIIELDHVFYAYHAKSGETPALSNISFQIHQNEFVAIVGPSGCGKSTLLSLLAGLLSPDQGQILKSSNIKIGYMLQKDLLLSWRSIWKNVMLGLEIQNQENEEKIEYAKSLLKEYELENFINKKPSELSGGMRQRVALIRTLVLNPDILLLDEPFSALDYQTRLIVSSDIASIIRKEKKTAIMITHDIAEAITLADRVIVLSDRPAKVLQDIPIHFSIDRVDPLAIRSTEEYHQYFDFIWRTLCNESE